jgi:hypothetical protein
MTDYKKLYLKYKKKYLKLKQQGGENESKTYDAAISIPIFEKDGKNNIGIIIGFIKVNSNDTYDQILAKINKVLDSHTLVNVKDFHYMQEDGDIAYVNKDIVDKTDLYDAIKFDPIFYVYYNY